MNIKVARILTPKVFRPDFIKAKDIRKITPDDVLNRFKDRATVVSNKFSSQDILCVSVERGEGKTPDIYQFVDGKFNNRVAHREKDGAKKIIITQGTDNGFYTKTYSKDANADNYSVTIKETIIGSVKKKVGGILGFLGLKSEGFRYRARFNYSAPTSMGNKTSLDSFVAKIYNTTKRIKVSDNGSVLKSNIIDYNSNGFSRSIIGPSKCDEVKQKSNNIPKLILNWINNSFPIK